jgi:hypothetical protein
MEVAFADRDTTRGDPLPMTDKRAESLADFATLSVTVTEMVKFPGEVGVQVNCATLPPEHPGGRPA